MQLRLIFCLKNVKKEHNNQINEQYNRFNASTFVSCNSPYSLPVFDTQIQCI